MLPSFRLLRSPRSLRTLEREALAPLLALAQAKDGDARRQWLEELRADAPTVATTLERLLADAESPEQAHAPHATHPSPATAAPQPGAAASAALPADRRLPYRPPAISPGLAR